jgi:hypothetical protein
MKKPGPIGIFFSGRKPLPDSTEASELSHADQADAPLFYADIVSDTAPASDLSEEGSGDPRGEAAGEVPSFVIPAQALATAEASETSTVSPIVTTAEPVAPIKPVVGRPHMSPPELVLLDRLMQSGFKRFLEFGSGGSTLLAVRSGIETIVSVDSDRSWSETIRQHPEIAPRVAAGQAAILYADIGQTKAFGAPVDETAISQWPNYIRLPWVEWDRRKATPDFVLVDGRFRVAACLSVIVAWHLSDQATPFPLIAIHDVTPERRSYQRLFRYFDSCEISESLHVLRLKGEVDCLGVFAALLGVQFDPS